MPSNTNRSLDKSLRISVKDFIWIIMLVASMIGMYYTLSGRADVLENEVEELNKEMHETNIKLLKHDIDYLKKRVDGLEQENKAWHRRFDDKSKGK